MIVTTADPLAMPPEERRNAALALLGDLRPEGEEPELVVSDTPIFFSGVEAAGSVYCPFCGMELDDWFSDEQDRLEESDPSALATTTPCCNRQTSLNDLDCDGEQGFGCVAIEIWNPGDDLEPAELQQLEAALGVPVRVIWQRI
jgi:hypothetical protein